MPSDRVVYHVWSLEEIAKFLKLASMNFEYQVLRIEFNNMPETIRALNDLGRQGWELIAVLQERPTTAIAFLKRPQR